MICFLLQLSNVLLAQTWPPNSNTPPSTNCGDLYLVSSTNANGDLEIAVNYHFKSLAQQAIDMESLNIQLSNWGTQSLIPNLNPLPNSNSGYNVTGGVAPTLTYATGVVTYNITNPKGFHFTQSSGQVTLFKL
jgi:hypothetical protein